MQNHLIENSDDRKQPRSLSSIVKNSKYTLLYTAKNDVNDVKQKRGVPTLFYLS